MTWMDVPSDKLLEPVVCMVSGQLGEGLHRAQNTGGLGPRVKVRFSPSLSWAVVDQPEWRMAFGALGGWGSCH